MTRDDIIRMAREAAEATGTLVPAEWNEPLLERFAGLVAAAERERNHYLSSLAVRWLRKFQTDMLPTPEMLEETHALIKDVRATVHGSPFEHIGENGQQ